MQNATSSDPVLCRALAAEIRTACVNVGFFYGKFILIDPNPHSPGQLAKNHGIPEAVIQAAVNSARRFFALPTEAKIEVGHVLSLSYIDRQVISWTSTGHPISKGIPPFSAKIPIQIIRGICTKALTLDGNPYLMTAARNHINLVR